MILKIKILKSLELFFIYFDFLLFSEKIYKCIKFILLLSDNLEFFGKLELKGLKYFKEGVEFTSEYKPLVLNYFEKQLNIGQYEIVSENNQGKVLYSPLATVKILYSGELDNVAVEIFSGSKEKLEDIISNLEKEKESLKELSEKEFIKNYPEAEINMKNGTGNLKDKEVHRVNNCSVKEKENCDLNNVLTQKNDKQNNPKRDYFLNKLNDFGEGVTNFFGL